MGRIVSREETTEDQEDKEAEGTVEFDFEEDLFVRGKSKEHMTRSQKWESRSRAGELELDLMLPSKETLMKLQGVYEDIQKLVQGTSTRDQFYRRTTGTIPKIGDKDCPFDPFGRSYGTRQDCKEDSHETPLAYSIQRCHRVL